MLFGEGQYNINDIKEIKVSQSYLRLDRDVRNCQNNEQFDNCTTTHYLDTILGECGCLPSYMRLTDNVQQVKHKIILINRTR